VSDLGLRLVELPLQLFDPRAALRLSGVSVLELGDELVDALLGFGGAGAVALDFVEDLGELGAALVLEIVDEVARLADDVVLEAGAELGHRGVSQNIGRGWRIFRCLATPADDEVHTDVRAGPDSGPRALSNDDAARTP
jgi:hypothetical protein